MRLEPGERTRVRLHGYICIKSHAQHKNHRGRDPAVGLPHKTPEGVTSQRWRGGIGNDQNLREGGGRSF